MNTRTLFSLIGASVTSFIIPTLNHVWLCTAMIAADFISARMLARRLKRHNKVNIINEQAKFSSRKFGATLLTLTKAYALLLLAHGVDITIIGADNSISALKFASSLICFWQAWSILENEASANNATWARLAQKILIDKTQRHLDIDLSELKKADSSSAMER